MNNIFSHQKTIDLMVHNHPIGTSIAFTIDGKQTIECWSVWDGEQWIHGCAHRGLPGIVEKNGTPLQFFA